MEMKKNTFSLVFEAMVWMIYVCLYKYAHYLQEAALPNPTHIDFPYLQLVIYALMMTVYIIPFYRWIAPALLRQRKYGIFVLVTIPYFALLPKFTNWIISWLFMQNSTGPLHIFYADQFDLYSRHVVHITGWDLKILLTDWITFLSLIFARHAFEVERSKRRLEKEHFRLQVEALKAQLNPHFLFNMLNSIYGMSLAGSPDTPGFILRMAEMMRFILYEGKEVTVLLENDLKFIENYIEMEKKRYPEADIRFSIVNQTKDKRIVPLLLIPFIENSFKHGAHRVMENGKVEGSVIIKENELDFSLSNDRLPTAMKQDAGGVGLENVRKRLEAYYPGQYTLTILKEEKFNVRLQLTLKQAHV
jgi:hypothetical protein